MALHPNKFRGQDRLQPGARGEKFKVNLPGYRNDEDRINRTNTQLNLNDHDVPNIKYQLDDRLPALFRYGYAVGFNQIVIPKGRIVAVDKYMDLIDFDMQHAHNTLTLANGGVPVELRKQGQLYKTAVDNKLVSEDASQLANIGLEWTPLVGQDKAYELDCYRPFKVAEGGTFKTAEAMLKAAGYEVDTETGRVVNATGEEVAVLCGNTPIGIMERNEYTRDDDAYNGMMPGAVRTDAMVELPWFAAKDKAENNPWGSVYGVLLPGMLVKSDENGRFVPSPLSFPEHVATMSLSEYEIERQQVIGEVFAVDKSLLPEGAAKWVQWALEDRLNFEEFNPEIWAQNNRRGEDIVNNTPYRSTGRYPGYGVEKNYHNYDLHMAGGFRSDLYDRRLQLEHRLDQGIPGLTDGFNAVKTRINNELLGTINSANADGSTTTTFKKDQKLMFRTLEVNVFDLTVSAGDYDVNTELKAAKVGDKIGEKLVIEYIDAQKGLVQVKALVDFTDVIEVKASYIKRGLAGVPTFLDWDGCIGTAKILLTK